MNYLRPSALYLELINKIPGELADAEQRKQREAAREETRTRRRRKRKPRVQYRAYLKSPAWRRLRRAVLARDEYRCCGCGSRRDLQVHHLTYERLGREQLDDLATLCDACHRGVHEALRPERRMR